MRYFLIVICLLLAACSTPASPSSQLPTSTPASLLVADLDARNALATAQARADEIERLGLEATAQAEATRSAYAFSATATADTLAIAQLQSAMTITARADSARATATSQAVAVALEATKQTHRATQAARELDQQRDADAARRERQLAEFWITFLPAAAIILSSTVLAIAAWAIIAWISSQNERRYVIETRAGTGVWVPDVYGRRVLEILVPPPLLAAPAVPGVVPDIEAVTEATIIDAHPLTPGGSVWVSSMEREESGDVDRVGRALARALITDAIQVVGANATQIPSWPKLKGAGKDWDSSRWQRAVGALKDTGAAIAEAGKGTFLQGFADLVDLRDAIDGRRISFMATIDPPTLPPNGHKKDHAAR